MRWALTRAHSCITLSTYAATDVFAMPHIFTTMNSRVTKVVDANSAEASAAAAEAKEQNAKRVAPEVGPVCGHKKQHVSR